MGRNIGTYAGRMIDWHDIPDGAGRSVAPGASALYLPRLKVPPATILDYLAARFPHVAPCDWRARMLEGRVVRSDGGAIDPMMPYEHGITIHYFREVERELPIPFREEIIFHGRHFLIADKPHFLPVVPSGPYVNECLLFRLRRRTGLDALTPVHRLDRETAGLVLFALDPEMRSLYHRLFARRTVGKQYLAVARGSVRCRDPFVIRSHLARGNPWFRMQSVVGSVNAVTHVQVIGGREDRLLLRLRPETGKKHQIRVHLHSIGLPIINDRLYPDVHPYAPYDFSAPLQLLAHRLSFTDPLSGRPMEFTSERRLEEFPEAGEMDTDW